MENLASSNDMWYQINNVNEVCSPALLVYPDRIEHNIQKMIEIAGNVNQLRPHVKTHKMSAIIRLQMEHGISKYKCATISETEMVAKCGAKDILLAMQPVGPNLGRFFQLKQEFHDARISCIADSEEVILQLSDMALKTGMDTHVWLDINNGMNRTGIPPDANAASLFKLIIGLPKLKAEGLHVYDGHIHEKDFSLRQKICNDSFGPVTSLIDKLKNSGIAPIKVVAGGTPTFPIHASRKGVESSPGTLLLWDYGYSSSFSDMDFLHAAVLLTRIISKPAKDLLCLDLGHKAVASEMPQPRIKILGIGNYTIVNHNEEHMVIRTTESGSRKIGDPLYCIPWHICPTVDRFDTVSVVNEHKATGEWNVEARKRKITF
ncbi:MAG: D-TA family PLP-dependent enzyme [Bacteroidia bacterium]|nr:D-TA family PLP-dependent enzyme [Bacteroidia bacterium]